MNILEVLLNLITGVIGFGFSIIFWIIRVILAGVVGITAAAKGRNGWIWALVTLLVPWTFFIIFLVGRKYPKFPRHIAEDESFKGKNPMVASIMALSAMIAKSNGSISKEEVKYIKDYVTSRFNVSREALDDYVGAFNYGKDHPEDYQIFTGMIRGCGQLGVLNVIAYLFVGLSLEGEHTSQKEVIARQILTDLGVSPYEYAYIKRSFTGEGYSYSGYQGGAMGGPSKSDLVKKYTEVLGVSPDASMNEIKKAYRKLVKEYHPDKLAAENAPPEYVEFANKKIRDINEAYEYLEKNL